MASKRVTSNDVAIAAGVSRTTVSMVLNNVTHIKISPETRQHVLETAQRLGYVPNAAARALASSRSQIIGLVMARHSHHILSDAFLNLLLAGFLNSVHQQSLRLMIEIVEPQHQQETYLQLTRSKHIDGLILAGVRQDDEGAYMLLKEGIPAVLIGSMPDSQIDTIDVDNRRASRDMVDHLIGLGHTRIACITNAPLDYSSPSQRLEGYFDALEAAGLTPDKDLIRIGDYTTQSGYEQMNSLLESKANITAAYVASDVVAQGAMAAIHERGLRIPRDIAVVGFDDVPFARYLVPSLTTIHVPAQQMAEKACEMLIRRIEIIDAPLQHIILPTEIIVRDSCGAK